MNGRLISLIAGILPMLLYAWFLYYLDRYEKEPLKLLLGVFLWGALVAGSAAFAVNSLSSFGIFFFTQSEFAAQVATTTLVAPVVEETLKGMALLIIFLLFRPEFDSPLDGIVYGGIAALGFAATENVWYIHQFGYLQNGMQGLLEITLVRVVLVGWQHPFYTAFTGLGFALARRSNDFAYRWIYPVLGWGFAIAFHLLHNLFATFLSRPGGPGLFNLFWDWSGYLGLLALILLLINREKGWMRIYLAPEMDRGLLTPRQYQIACSAWRQGLIYLRSLFTGNARNSRRYYQICGDLMHKLRQQTRDGSSPETQKEIDRLRAGLASQGKNA